MKRRFIAVFIYCMFIGLFFVESAWSRQVVTDADRSRAQDALSQEKTLNVEPLPGVVAVLYFLNESGKAEWNPLVKGFALLLITDLSNVEGIQAVERVRLQALAEELGLGASGLVTPGSAPRVGRLLGASNVVSGTIFEGLTEKLRILPNIFNIPDEELLNLSSVEGDLADLFRLEKEILFAIIDQVLETPLPDKERTRLMEPMTKSVEAFLFLCKGLAFGDMGNFGKAAGFYEKALKEDPNLFLASEFLRELKSRGLVKSKINNRSFLKGVRNSTSLTDRLSPDRPLQRKRTPKDVELRKSLRLLEKNAEDNDGDTYSEDQGDCDDTDDSIHPGAAEVCGDGIDQDCNGSDISCDDVDNDMDGYTESAGDCNDENRTIHPGAIDICSDGIDQDCDGSDIICDDLDNDGDGYTVNNGDCDDSDASIFPGASEICDDGIDQNCNGYDLVCENDDYDEDGYSLAQGDCNDEDSSIYPGATEICEDGIDQDCNGRDTGCDADGDGYSVNINDCNDDNRNINPAATEICNGVDDDCDGSIDEGCQTFYQDSDGDGYGSNTVSESSMSRPSGYVSTSGDCNDGNASIHSNATEICNNMDDDCDGSIDEGCQTFYQDSDGDGYGSNTVSESSMSQPSGYISITGDCDDNNDMVSPDMDENWNFENCSDGLDNDCDGFTDSDDSGCQSFG